MQDLVGRIKALDPVATESLRIIAYFDALVEGHASAEALLRGASALTGCAAGFIAGETLMRVDVHGVRTPQPSLPPADRWISHTIVEDWRTWIERDGDPHANDEMVLERLALGLGISLERTHPIAIARRNLEILVDSAESAENRAVAAGRLRLDAGVHRIAAAPAREEIDPALRSVVITTSVGRVRAILVGSRVIPELPRPLGVGVPSTRTDLARSWHTALLALRMTGATDQTVDAAALGSVLLLAEAADASPTPQPDVVMIERLVDEDRHNLEQLQLIVHAESIRAAALASGVHHSTMQVRVSEFSERAGFDVRAPDGRIRLALALRLYRLATTRFV